MLAWVVLVLALLVAMGPTAHAGDSFNASGIDEWRFSAGYSTPSFVSSGCVPTFPGTGLTSNAFACTAFVSLAAGQQEAVIQPSIAFTLPSSGDGAYWLMVYRDTSSSVPGWVRSATTATRGSRYLAQKLATRPADVDGGLIVARITVTSGNVSIVEPLAGRGPLARETGNIIVSKYATGGNGTLDHPWSGWYSAMPLLPNTTYYFPTGVYTNSLTTNFPFENVTIVSDGILLKHTGAGAAFGCDVGVSGAAVYNFTTHGKMTIQGNANTTDGVALRGCHHVELDKIRVHDVAQSGMRTNWVVGLHARHFTVSNNEKDPWLTTGAFLVTPQKGIHLDARGTGEYTSIAVFTVPVIESVSVVGIDVVYARDILFNTGTSEHNPLGIRTEANSARVTINSMDFEQNSVSDGVFSGVDHQVINSNFQSAGSGPTINIVTAKRTKFLGGYQRDINMQSTSEDTLFIGSSVHSHPALGIHGPGSYKAFSIVEIDDNYAAVTRPSDHLALQGAFTPVLAGTTTAGVFTYATQAGYCSRVAEHVSCTVNIALSGITTPAVGTLTIGGFPHIASSSLSFQAVAVGQWSNITLPSASYRAIGGYINPGGTALTLTASGDNVAALGLSGALLSATSSLILNIHYVAAQN